MAEFYSAVMSSRSIPEWDAREEPSLPHAHSLFDVHVDDYISSAAPLQQCPVLDAPISLDEVSRAIKGLKGSTAPGPDEVPSLFLKKSPLVVHELLTMLFDLGGMGFSRSMPTPFVFSRRARVLTLLPTGSSLSRASLCVPLKESSRSG